jgi:hypothetical protein
MKPWAKTQHLMHKIHKMNIVIVQVTTMKICVTNNGGTVGNKYKIKLNLS